MSTVAIQVESLSKRYQLGTIGYGSLQHDLAAWWSRFKGTQDPNARIGEPGKFGRHDDFWALSGISFEVNQGDRVGIVGKNGAGKSTLLKLLSRVTTPTTGSIRIKGRIASLLEVGTGFHPELTGRENVYLNGAILGMKRREIQDKFDEIVEFSGVEKFIDTPVKRYSSGMYVRLAFSVAAHLESEILIVDEVLAVGDAEFQRKCLGKMEDLNTRQGKTLLFVSHQINVLREICSTGLFLKKGQIVPCGTTFQDVERAYLESGPQSLASSFWVNNGEFENEYFTPLELSLVDSSGSRLLQIARSDKEVYVKIVSQIRQRSFQLNFGLSILNEHGDIVYTTWINDVKSDAAPVTEGRNTHRVLLLNDLLNVGEYRLVLHAGLHHVLTILDDASLVPEIVFQVRGPLGIAFGDDERGGVIAPLQKWHRDE